MILKLIPLLIVLTACNPLSSQPSTDAGFGASAISTPSPVPFQFFARSSVVGTDGLSVVLELVTSNVGSIQPATNVTGFSISVNGAPVTISSASRTSISQLTLTLSSVIASTDTVTLSYSAGNIVDSTGAALPPFAGFNVTNSSSFDTDAVSYFSRIASNGGTISQTSKSATQTFVTNLKTAGLWSKLIEIYPFAGDQLSAALVKLKIGSGAGSSLINHGFVTADYVSTGATGGLQGNGSNYIDSGLSVMGLSRSDISFGSYISVDGSNAAGFCISMGSSYNASGDNDRFYIMGGGSSSTHGQPGLGSFYPDGIFDGIGLRTVTYDGSVVSAYRNGTVGASRSGVSINWQQPGTVLIYKGAGPFFHDGRVPLAYVGTALSAADVANLYTLIQAFETSLGRNI